MVYKCIDPADDWDAYCADQVETPNLSALQCHLDDIVAEVLANKDTARLMTMLDEAYAMIDREQPLSLVMYFKEDDKPV